MPLHQNLMHYWVVPTNLMLSSLIDLYVDVCLLVLEFDRSFRFSLQSIGLVTNKGAPISNTETRNVVGVIEAF